LREGECRLAALPDGLTAFYQISVQLETPAEAAAVTARVKAAFGSRLNPLQNNFCLDIVAPAVNKAFGLRRVAALFGGVEAEIIAVGDNVNDLDMLRAFPSYAMENGVEEAKAAAKNTIASVDELILRELNM
jgi:hydroxymethylpyrimidine pyrophosphatase-like HAD family hydrolase